MPIDFVTLALAKQMIGGDGGEGGSVKIDTTLTKKGFAADAKATGEAITSHKSRIDSTSGGAVGKIPCIKSLNSEGLPQTWEFVDITDILPVYNGEVGEV